MELDLGLTDTAKGSPCTLKPGCVTHQFPDSNLQGGGLGAGRVTLEDYIEKLDPKRDHVEIYHLMAGYEFPWDIDARPGGGVL